MNSYSESAKAFLIQAMKVPNKIPNLSVDDRTRLTTCISELETLERSLATELVEEEDNDHDSAKVMELRRQKEEVMKDKEALQDLLNETRPRYFNKYRVLANIRYLIKKNPNVKVSDIEKAAGVNAGYLSRLEKPQGTTNMNSEVLMTAAAILGVSVNVLVYYDLEKMNGSELQFITVMNRLVEQSLEGNQLWDSWSLKELTDEEAAKSSKGSGYDFSDYANHSIRSKFFPDRTIIPGGTCYQTKMEKQQAVLDLLYVRENKDGEPPFYEVYLSAWTSVGEWVVHPVCCSKIARPEISSAIDELYKTATKTCSSVRLDEETKYIFDSFLNDGEEE